MNFEAKEGNYEVMSASSDGKNTVFTFECPKEKESAILLYEKGQKNVICRIAVPSRYTIGNLRSVAVASLDLGKYDYNIEIAGKEIVDPYARKIIGREIWADTERKPADLKSGILKDKFDWSKDKHLGLTDEEMIVYKLHIRNYSMAGSARGKKRGTFTAVKENLWYFKELGISTLEIMPVYEFEEVRHQNVIDRGKGYSEWKKNYEKTAETAVAEHQEIRYNCWGYGTGNYFAVKRAYAYTKNPERELKELILAMHEAGMECILEFYFGDDMNQNFIMDVLRYWVREYHVDGYHILGLQIPVELACCDPLLQDTKIFYSGFGQNLISEKTDKNRLFVYNDEFLYPVRKMLSHRDMDIKEFTDQIIKNYYGQGFINYITSNNGFTMADLFSYEIKHNEKNGEDGKDGSDWNYSTNCGVEGETRKKAVILKRKKMMRNAFAILLLAKGVPLIYEGDEIANSQKGNNNAYCIDDEDAYVNWKNRGRQKELFQFVQELIHFRKTHPVLTLRECKTEKVRVESGFPLVSLHGESAWTSQYENHSQAVGILCCGEYALKDGGITDDMIYIGFNFSEGRCKLALPKIPGGKTFERVMDTIYENPFSEKQMEKEQSVVMEAQSVALFIGTDNENGKKILL